MKVMDRLRNFMAARKRTEEGAGSISLMVASLAVTIMAGMVLTSATLSLSTTYDQISQRQADASVDFALNDAVSKFNADQCFTAGYTSPNGDWRWQIFKTKNETMPTSNQDANVYSGCPTPEDKWVLIVATGSGRENTFSKKIAVYKTYGDGSNTIPQAITGKKVEMNNNIKIEQAQGVANSNGSMYVGSEGLICNNSNLKLNVFSLAGGTPSQLTNCPITGDYNTQRITYFGINSYLYGDLCSTVGVTSQSAPMIKGNLKQSDSSCNNKVKGTFYGYLPSVTESMKFTGTQCSSMTTMKARIEQMTGDNNIADLRGCTDAQINSTLNSSGAETLSLKGNVTILLKEGQGARNLTISSADGKPHTLSFATPSSSVSSTQSTCGVAGSTNTYSNLKYTSGTSGILYSPCSLTVNNSTINGQIYSGENLLLNSNNLNYSLVELPHSLLPVSDIGRGQQLIRVY